MVGFCFAVSLFRWRKRGKFPFLSRASTMSAIELMNKFKFSEKLENILKISHLIGIQRNGDSCFPL